MAGLLIWVGVVFVATACGSYVDGDQWAGVTITNNTSSEVTLDLHEARHLAPGNSTLLAVDSNSNPQQLRVRGEDGAALGCLVFRFRTRSAEKFSVNTSDITTCDESLRLMSG